MRSYLKKKKNFTKSDQTQKIKGSNPTQYAPKEERELEWNIWFDYLVQRKDYKLMKRCQTRPKHLWRAPPYEEPHWKHADCTEAHWLWEARQCARGSVCSPRSLNSILTPSGAPEPLSLMLGSSMEAPATGWVEPSDAFLFTYNQCYCPASLTLGLAAAVPIRGH